MTKKKVNKWLGKNGIIFISEDKSTKGFPSYWKRLSTKSNLFKNICLRGDFSTENNYLYKVIQHWAFLPHSPTELSLCDEQERPIETTMLMLVHPGPQPPPSRIALYGKGVNVKDDLCWEKTSLIKTNLWKMKKLKWAPTHKAKVLVFMET